MPPLYDFRCAAGHTSEARADRSERAIQCPDCDLVAQRVVGYPNALPGVTGGARVPMNQRHIALGRAQEAHDTIVYEAEKAGVEPPDTLAIAKREAEKVRRDAPELITGT